MRRAADLDGGVVAVDDSLDLVVRTRARFDFVDLTDHLGNRVGREHLLEGACVAFARHTTCALIVNEWERGALADFRRRLEDLFPAEAYYEHDDLGLRTQNLVPGERSNGHAHVAQMLMGGSSVTIPVRAGRLLLGRWQRVILVELDSPRERSVAVQLLGPRGSVLPLESPADQRRRLPKLSA